MRFEPLKVGELAQRTGLTVRTLHHYDAIGLLRPSLHTEAGYRLYTAGDIARLQQVLSLRQLGFSLDEVRGCLDRPGFSPLEVIGLHLVRLREQMESHRRLCERLDAIAVRLRLAGEVSADEFLDTIEEMTMLETLAEKYFTPEQLHAIKEAREQAGPENLNRMQEYWAELIALIRTEMEQGTDPADPKVQALAQRWQELLTRSTGGDPGIKESMKRLWEEQGDALAAQFGSKYDSRPIWGYIETAIRHGEGTAAANSVDQTVRDHEGAGGGADRRGFLKCMAWAGTGLVGMAGRTVRASHAFDQEAGQAGATGGRSSFASFDGTRIAYSDEGDGPAVVLLHGFGLGGLDNFGHFDRMLPKLERMRALVSQRLGAVPPLVAPPAEGQPGLAVRLREAGARVIVPDLRGFGASDKPQDTRAYADSAMARDVIALVRHLGLKAVDVLGFSMGSVIAAKLLALGAPHIRSAVLAGVAQYILEGEVFDLPKNFPIPEDLPRPFTMRSACRGVRTNAGERGQRYRGAEVAQRDPDAVRGGRPQGPRRCAPRYDGSTGPGRSVAPGQGAGAGAQWEGGPGQSSRRAAPRSDSERAFRLLRRRPPHHALVPVLPASGHQLLCGTVARQRRRVRSTAVLGGPGPLSLVVRRLLYGHCVVGKTFT